MGDDEASPVAHKAAAKLQRRGGGSTEIQMPVTIDIEGDHTQAPPRWAVLQRHVFDKMAAAAKVYVETYTRPDGSLIWHEKETPWVDAHGRPRYDHAGNPMPWPGMDGSDDGYEAFFSIPLLYCLGGDGDLDPIARKQWEAVTWQFTGYGQVFNEFDAHYDWMHHGESSQFIYYLGLSNPHHYADRARSLKFAGMYMGEDPVADNWDPELKMIKSPFNGSKGAHTVCTEFDWCTHRDQLSALPTEQGDVGHKGYLCPFLDHPAVPEGASWDHAIDWNDDAVMEVVLQQMNERQASGDIPMNLLATSLMTHAYLYAPADKAKYKTWVLEYLQAWEARTAANGGILPDNVGPTGKVGECMPNGQWWGGYYGYRWPHGIMNSQESILVAGSNAFMLTADPRSFELYRSQTDMIWSLGRMEDGVWKIPARHSDDGWCDYREPKGVAGFERNRVLLYYYTGLPEDKARMMELPGAEEGWPLEVEAFGKGGQFETPPWHTYAVDGGNVDYPMQVLDATLREIGRRMELIESDDWSQQAIDHWDVHHWQNFCPAVPQGLLQLTCGTPGIVYHGGLLNTRLFHFDPVARRPGLPPNVAALVHSVRPDGVSVTIVNTDVLERRPLIIQAGAFGEHSFTTATFESSGRVVQVDGQHLQLNLGAGAQVKISLGMVLHANTSPSYLRPWDTEGESVPPHEQSIRALAEAAKL